MRMGKDCMEYLNGDKTTSPTSIEAVSTFLANFRLKVEHNSCRKAVNARRDI